jgi:heterodisulfide reductase subunit C2
MPTTLPSDAELLADLKLHDCYQCGNCSAGCPLAHTMDLLPNRLVQLAQMGQVEKAAASEAIWQCVSCMTCTTRCPKSVDCAGVIDALRQISIARGIMSAAKRRTVLFQRAFLDNIRRNGRLSELELVGTFKSRAFLGDRNVRLLLKDALLGPKLARRGKLHLTGQRVKDRAVVQRIFARCMACQFGAGLPTLPLHGVVGRPRPNGTRCMANGD